MLAIRSLSKRLVAAVKRWKKNLRRATATFMVSQHETDAVEIHCLSKSSRSLSRPATQAASSEDKCVLCAVRDDKSLRRSHNILINKFKFFVGDFVVFTPRTESQIDADIALAAKSDLYPKPVSTFSHEEICAFKRIANRLKTDQPEETREVLRVISQHLCTETRLTSPEKK